MSEQTLDILNPSGSLIRQHILSVNCTRKFSLMNEDSITLRFWTREAMQFPIGSSVGDFFITTEQVGKWNENTGVWDYELKFDAYYWAWANKILRYIINGADTPKETSFTLTATIDIHAQVIKNCLDFLGLSYDGSPFRIDTTDTSLSLEAKLIRYENLSVLGGIQAIAEAFECEWWVDGNAVYFGRCENKASNHVFEAGINTSSISFSSAKITAPNRLYVYGSTRNLPPNYRKTDAEDTIGGVVARKLMLPSGIPYLQTREDIPEAEIVESVVVLDDVYPRTDLTISEEPETYTADGEDEEGNTTTETFYRIRYGNDFHFSESYVLPNEELHIIFESGLLNGMDFGARFNPKGLNEKNTDGSWNPLAQMIEIVANEDYGRKLPDEILRPKKGDKFILYGWNTTKMADLGLIADAEQELLEEGMKALEEYAKDLTTCTCPMAWDYMKPLFAANTQPKPGDAVTIIDTAHFGEGGRKSRIIGYEYKLDKPYAECTYTCGENISTKRLDSIEKKIEGLSKSGTKVQMQNSLDFLSKRYADRTPYLLSSDEGFEAGRFVAGLTGGRIDGRGNGELESLRVRSFMEIAELIVNRMSTVEGDVIYTEGDTIEAVYDNGDGSFTLKMHEQWEGYTTAQYEHNVIKGIFNNITSGLTPGDGQQKLNNAVYYTSWMNVVDVDAVANLVTVILYGDDETPAGKNFPPQAMMKVARWGNSGDANEPEYARRQTCFVMSQSDGRLTKLTGVTKPIIDIGNISATFGSVPETVAPGDPRVKPGESGIYVKTLLAENIINVKHQERPVATTVDRGVWREGEVYYDGTTLNADNEYERSMVWHEGHGWLCNTDNTAAEDNQPRWNTTYWTHVQGNPSLELDFEEVDSIVELDDPKCPLTVKATYRGDNVTLSPAIYYEWSRKSKRNGAEDTASDTVWNNDHKNGGHARVLDAEDMNFQFGVPPEALTITVTAILHDPNNPNNPQTASVELEMI